MEPQSVPLPRTRRAPTSFRPHRSRLRQCLAFALLHPGACGAIPLLHIPAAVSADFRLIVDDTGSPKNIHNNAADLFDTSPSDKVFITADGTRVPATCVGKLPLILTDTSGRADVRRVESRAERRVERPVDSRVKRQVERRVERRVESRV